MSDEVQDARRRADRYDQLMMLADSFDATGQRMREQSQLGDSILRESDVTESAALSPLTYESVEEAIRLATTGKHSLLSRSVELDADALVLRANVLTYRWIDDLQEAAYKTLGAIGGRAIGFLAPEVELGGAVVSAGLIETDALDRDGVAAYLNELAENHPDLLDHVANGGGGILESLQMRSLLTVGFLAGSGGPAASRGGLRAVGVEPMRVDAASALRDIAGDFMWMAPPEKASDAAPRSDAPASVERLLDALSKVEDPVQVIATGPDRFIAFLTGPAVAAHVVGGDQSDYVAAVVRALAEATAASDDPHVLLVGSARGGQAAVDVACLEMPFVIEQIVTAGAPASHVHRLPETIRVLSLEDRSDPVALLGSLISHGLPNRVTVLFDGDGGGPQSYVAGGRAVDEATAPELRAEVARLVDAGFLTAR